MTLLPCSPHEALLAFEACSVFLTSGIYYEPFFYNTAGMALAGAGAGVNELTALAATSEMAPTSKRGKYVAVLIFTIVPFCPSVLWSQLIAYYSNWRYVGAFAGAWNGFGLLATIFFYSPPPRVNSKGLSRSEILRRIDWVGGFLSIAGLILFMAGMQWGGYMASRPRLGLGPSLQILIILKSNITYIWSV